MSGITVQPKCPCLHCMQHTPVSIITNPTTRSQTTNCVFEPRLLLYPLSHYIIHRPLKYPSCTLHHTLDPHASQLEHLCTFLSSQPPFVSWCAGWLPSVPHRAMRNAQCCFEAALPKARIDESTSGSTLAPHLLDPSCYPDPSELRLGQVIAGDILSGYTTPYNPRMSFVRSTLHKILDFPVRNMIRS